MSLARLYATIRALVAPHPIAAVLSSNWVNRTQRELSAYEASTKSLTPIVAVPTTGSVPAPIALVKDAHLQALLEQKQRERQDEKARSFVAAYGSPRLDVRMANAAKGPRRVADRHVQPEISEICEALDVAPATACALYELDARRRAKQVVR